MDPTTTTTTTTTAKGTLLLKSQVKTFYLFLSSNTRSLDLFHFAVIAIIFLIEN